MNLKILITISFVMAICFSTYADTFTFKGHKLTIKNYSNIDNAEITLTVNAYMKREGVLTSWPYSSAKTVDKFEHKSVYSLDKNTTEIVFPIFSLKCPGINLLRTCEPSVRFEILIPSINVKVLSYGSGSDIGADDLNMFNQTIGGSSVIALYDMPESSVETLATFSGMTSDKLAVYLSQFKKPYLSSEFTFSFEDAKAMTYQSKNCNEYWRSFNEGSNQISVQNKIKFERSHLCAELNTIVATRDLGETPKLNLSLAVNLVESNELSATTHLLYQGNEIVYPGDDFPENLKEITLSNSLQN